MKPTELEILGITALMVVGSIACMVLSVPDRLHRKWLGGRHHVRKFGG